MSDKLHLIVPGAVLAPEEGGGAGIPSPLPANLRALLAAMAPAGRVEASEDSLSSPCEIATAQALGLPAEDGRIPWAAVETSGMPGLATAGQPCAWVRLCHWRVGADHVALVPAQDLALDDGEAQALLAAMAPYFQEDGIALREVPGLPGSWLATGDLFRALPTLSMERAAAQRLTPASLGGGGAASATLRRLQNEMQMLLYTHPQTEQRLARGLLPVNSFWVSGAGVLDQPFQPVPHVKVESRLAAAAQRGDAAAHAAAWAAVDADSCAGLLAVLRAGGDARLTLCGPRAAQTLAAAPTGLWGGIKRSLGLDPGWNGFATL